jgi:hypothetical protein
MLCAVQQPVAAHAAGAAFHAAHVGAGAGFGHGQRIHFFAAYGGQQIALFLLVVGGAEDVGGTAPEYAERHAGAAEFAFQQREGGVVQAAAAVFGGDVGGVEAQGQDLATDFFAKLRGDLTGALYVGLEFVQLGFHEIADGVHDHLLLVGKAEIHPYKPEQRGV